MPAGLLVSINYWKSQGRSIAKSLGASESQMRSMNFIVSTKGSLWRVLSKRETQKLRKGWMHL